MQATEKEEKTMVDDVKETITDTEQPLGEKAPAAPFAIVALTYLSLLAVAALGVGLLIWLFS